jgi:hypothetical protein
MDNQKKLEAKLEARVNELLDAYEDSEHLRDSYSYKLGVLLSMVSLVITEEQIEKM